MVTGWHGSRMAPFMQQGRAAGKKAFSEEEERENFHQSKERRIFA